MRRQPATVAQQARWKKLARLADNIHTTLDLLALYGENETRAYLYWSPRAPDMPDPRPLSQQVANLQVGFRQIRDAMAKVDDGIFGVEFRADGDLNIVDPRPENMGGWIVVAVGVVVIAGLAYALYERDKTARKVTRNFNAMSRATDRMFCKESSPQTCSEWKRWKKVEGYQEQKDWLDDALKKIGVGGSAGLRYGLMIAIPLAVFFFTRWLEEKTKRR